jgi:DNA transposition AAA+ family ATPase
MRITEEMKQQLERELPSRAAVQEELRNYLAVTGMNVHEFAQACSRSVSAITFFLAGTYNQVAESDLFIRKAVREFIIAHPVIAETKAPGMLYKTEDYQHLLKYFYLALRHHRAYVVQADPGIGKTFNTKHLIAELNRKEMSKNGTGRRAYFVRASGTMKPTQLLREIAIACGVSSVGDSRRILRMLRRTFTGRSVLIVIDEAQQLCVSALEAVRELLDESPNCGLLVIGSHELEHNFTLHAIELEQWNSRIAGFRTLDGLNEDGAMTILAEEFPKTPKTELHSIVEDCRVAHLRSVGKQRPAKYISARRLFTAIEDLKSEEEESDE